MAWKFFFGFVLITRVYARVNIEIVNTAFDQNLYEEVLDAEECDRQIRFIQENSFLALQFADAGIRLPRGLLNGNSVDLGNYHQCLGINMNVQDMELQGKYCAIRVPMNQTFHLPGAQGMFPWSQFNPKLLSVDDETLKKYEEFDLLHTQVRALTGAWEQQGSRTLPVGPLAGTTLRLSVCIPKPCSTQQAMTSFLFNLTSIGFRYTDDFCRLPNDKPWVAADYITVVLFSIIGILTVLSTSYDLFCTFVLKEDRKNINVIYQSFSVYNNGRRLMTFSSGSGNLQCLDGIRSLAMMWVIIGHGFSTERFMVNNFDLWNWMLSLEALWITSGTITVDTFFTLGGLLLVYTTAGKMNGVTLLKNLHLFYLNRIIRMLPLLGAAVLLQASYINRMLDGPFWTTVARQTNVCRTYWWTTLLHIQNLVNPNAMCISHSWYIAIDVQLYLVSPLVLFWVLGGKRRDAWWALTLGLLVPLTAATIFNFQRNFPAGTIVPSRFDPHNYMADYYFNTLTRAAPFFVGMIFGYILHIYRKKKVQMPWVIATILWVCALSITNCIFFFVYFIKQFDWDNQLIDNLMNSFMRPAWAMALGWIVFACVHGYGGPANWFLCLDIWKLPARLSYGMFIFHYPLMFAINDATVSTNYFSVPRLTFMFLAHYTLALVVSFVLTLLVDSPFSVIFKQLLDKKQQKPPPVTTKLIEDGKLNTKNVVTNNVEANENNESMIDKHSKLSGTDMQRANGVNHTEANGIIDKNDADEFEANNGNGSHEMTGEDIKRVDEINNAKAIDEFKSDIEKGDNDNTKTSDGFSNDDEVCTEINETNDSNAIK